MTILASPWRNVHQPFLFEVAWEVANKVGGINTVLKTKAKITADEFGESYCMIGPLAASKARLEVEEQVPSKPEMALTLARLHEAGIRTLYGRWLIDGSPTVLLFDLASAMHRLDEWKADLWTTYGISSPAGDSEMSDAIVFGYLAAWFFGEFCYYQVDRAVIAHYHEWQASVGLVLGRRRRLPLATIFTTHATLLGRYLCAGDVDFYNHMRWFDVDLETGKRGIYHRYCLERAAAHCADVFTTVSHITAYEAEHLLKRKPDGVLPNGLNVVKFSAMHEFQNLHVANKAKIHSFVQGHFYGHYTDFDMDNILYVFTAGRYEYRNKGVDLFLEGLARLNHHLKQYNSPITVVAFIIMPAATNNYNVEALKGQALTKQLKETVDEVTEKIGRRLYESALRGTILKPEAVIQDADVVQLKRNIFALRRATLPPIVTHNMLDSSSDLILTELRRLQLINAPTDRVKVVFHPEFLSSNNPVLGMEYEDFVRGCHLGVFPSYYEPWGYTPAECTVMGVPSITTNLSGFGCYIEETVENPSDYGIYVVDRRLKSVEESVQQLADYFIRFCQQSRRQRINLRNRTERLSELLDWRRMGLEYRKARQLALRRVYPEAFAASEKDTENEGSSLLEIGATGEKIQRPPSVSPLTIEVSTEDAISKMSLVERGSGQPAV